MRVETPSDSIEYFVLSNGELTGPFRLEELSAGLRDGRFTAVDLVQGGEQPLWQPISLVVKEKAEEKPGQAVVPEWKAILRFAWERLRLNLRQHAVITGSVCLLVAAAVLAISRWPFVFWIPWLALATWAGFALLSRRREVAGAILLLGVLAVPLTDQYLISQSLQRQTARVEGHNSASVPPAVLAVSPASASQAPADAPAQPPEIVPAVKGEDAAAPALAAVFSAADTEIPTEPQAAMLAVASVPAESAPARPEGRPESSVPVPAPMANAGPESPTQVARATAPQAVPPWERPPAPWEKKTTVPGQAAPTPEPGNVDPVQSHTDAFVIIKGRDGSGSGFIARMGNQTFLFSNIHVVADMVQPTFMRLDNVPMTPGAAEAAAGPDITRYLLNQPPANPLEIMTDVDANVRIGDQVVVMGNSGGGGVVTNIKGVIQGIGPDRLEVSAEFIPGNSGSPIIHAKSGKVIGIATYLTRRMDEFAPKSPGAQPPMTTPGQVTPPRAVDLGAIVVRRYGYRIDTVARWEPVHWPTFQEEARQIQQMSDLSEDIVGFLRSLQAKGAPNFATETLRRPATVWLTKMRAKHVSENDRLGATQLFLGQLRTMLRSDIMAGEARIRYTFFRNSLREEQQGREQLYTAFSEVSTSLASPTGRPGYR